MTPTTAVDATALVKSYRDGGVDAVAIVGVATEIGIEPTVRHPGDLGFIPVVVAGACAAGDAEAGARSMESLRYLGDAFLTDVAEFRRTLAPQG